MIPLSQTEEAMALFAAMWHRPTMKTFMTELFSSSDMACESPRSKWMSINGVTLIDRGAGGCDEMGDYQRWLAEGLGRQAEGDTADEALSAWAVKTGTRFWNEEQNL